MNFKKLPGKSKSSVQPVEADEVTHDDAIRTSPFLKDELDKNGLPKDTLGREPFAENIADLIIQDAEAQKFDANGNIIPDTSPTVIGLEGDWGSGKTFTLGLIRKAIKEKKDDYLILEFKPWQFRDKDHLAQLYLEWLAENIEEPLSVCGKVNRFLGKAAIKLHSILIYLLVALIAFIIMAIFSDLTSTLAIGGAVASGVSAAIAHFKESLITNLPNMVRNYAANLEDSATLESKKDRIVEELKLNFTHKRIIIEIEDIDRLTPEEVRTMFQVVKMIADFPRITYLIPYDAEYVTNALNSTIAGGKSMKYGESLLQKTIYTSFHLPFPDLVQNAAILFRKTEQQQKHIFPADIFENEQGYWEKFQVDFSSLLTTPRLVQKVYNRSLIIFQQLGKNCHPADVLVVSYMLEETPKLWKMLLSDAYLTRPKIIGLLQERRTLVSCPPILSPENKLVAGC